MAARRKSAWSALLRAGLAGVLSSLLLPGWVTQSNASAQSLMIRDIQVIDPADADASSAPRTVLIADGVIREVAASSPDVSDDTLTIQGNGLFLMPGLVDMHVHLWDEAELGAYLAHGVTSIRNASGMPFHLELQRRVSEGALIGPRIVTTGPILNGPGPNAQLNHQIVVTAADARAAVRWQHEAGFRHLKVYSNLSREAYEAIRAEGATLGMTVMGHSPEGVREPGMPRQKPFNLPFEELLDDGFVTFEHTETIVWHGLRNELDEAKARALAKKIAAAGVAVDPTLLAYYSLMRVAQTEGAYLQRAGVELLNPFILEHEVENFERWSHEDVQAAERYFRFYQRATRIFHEEGVLLVAGSDAGIFTNVPGASLITELQLLVDSGLTPIEVLRAATINAARVLREDQRHGRVAPGYRADLLLLSSDPRIDIAAAGRPVSVIAGGVLLDKNRLQALRESAAHPSYERTRQNVMAGLEAQQLAN